MKITKQTKIQCATGSVEDMIDAFEARIKKLENFDNLEMSTDIEASTGKYWIPEEYDNYEEFLDAYSEYWDEDDMIAELAAVNQEITSYGVSPIDAHVFWRDDYEKPIVLIKGRYYYVDWRGGTKAVLTDVEVIDDLEELGLQI